MSHKNHQRGKGRTDKARPTVQGSTGPRSVKAVAPPASAPKPEVVMANDTAIIAETVLEPSKASPSAKKPIESPTLATAPVATPSASPPSLHNGTKPMNGHAPPTLNGNGAQPAAIAMNTNGNGVHPTPMVSSNGNGHLPGESKSTKHISQHTPTPPSELTEMFDTLRALFVRDRANGSRPDAARCGICYLTFAREELTYHEEAGFYACPDCQAALQMRPIPMLRRQRR